MDRYTATRYVESELSTSLCACSTVNTTTNESFWGNCAAIDVRRAVRESIIGYWANCLMHEQTVRCLTLRLPYCFFPLLTGTSDRSEQQQSVTVTQELNLTSRYQRLHSDATNSINTNAHDAVKATRSVHASPPTNSAINPQRATRRHNT